MTKLYFIRRCNSSDVADYVSFIPTRYNKLLSFSTINNARMFFSLEIAEEAVRSANLYHDSIDSYIFPLTIETFELVDTYIKSRIDEGQSVIQRKLEPEL